MMRIDTGHVGAARRIHFEGILDSRGQFYHDGHINRLSALTS